jgi:light-harvesting protein B-800-850 alpha chain
MIYGKLWCVVKPSVGLPMFFAGVAIASLAVHLAVLTQTDWYPRFLNGKAVAAPVAAAAPVDVVVVKK